LKGNIPFFSLLALPLIIVLIIGYETYSGYNKFGEQTVRTVVYLSKVLVSDVQVLGDITTAVFAVMVSALAPRAMSRSKFFITFLICFVGYTALFFFGVELEKGTTILGTPHFAWVQKSLEGYVPASDFENCIQTLMDTVSNARLYYLIIFATLMGLTLSKAKGKSDES